MVEQEDGGCVEAEAKDTVRYRSGPYKGKTCFIERSDRVKIQVELGFRTSRVEEFKLKNLKIPRTSDMKVLLGNVKSCLIVLIGGHTVVVDDVDDPEQGVHPARVFVPCKRPPEDVASCQYDGKVWLDLGDYLNKYGSESGFDRDVIKADYLGRR